MWSPNGDEVFYRSSSGLYSVKLDFDQFENVVIGETKLINDTPWIDNVGIGYDIHPSGDKFLMVVHKEKEVSDNDGVLHKGIAKRMFTKSFTIADEVEIKGAELKDGLLIVSMERVCLLYTSPSPRDS